MLLLLAGCAAAMPAPPPAPGLPVWTRQEAAGIGVIIADAGPAEAPGGLDVTGLLDNGRAEPLNPEALEFVLALPGGESRQPVGFELIGGAGQVAPGERLGFIVAFDDA
ncbi:MAG TPA: hypothetical protein VGE07_23435, partial [Herpetosiphonaceae bacterium]